MKVEKGLVAAPGCAAAGVAIRSVAERMGGKIEEAQTAGTVLSRCLRVKTGVGNGVFIVRAGLILAYGY